MILQKRLVFFVDENSRITYLKGLIKRKDPLLITLKSSYPKKTIQ